MKPVNVNDNNKIRSKAEPSMSSLFGTPATPLIGSRHDQHLMLAPTLIICSTTPDSTHEPGTPPSPPLGGIHDDHDDMHAAGSSEIKCDRSSETPPSNNVDDYVMDMNGTPPTPDSWIDRISSDHSMRDGVDDIAKVDAETPQNLLKERRNTSNSGISNSCTPRSSPPGASSVESRPPHNFFRKYPSSSSTNVSSSSNTKTKTIDSSKVKVSRPAVNKKRKHQTSNQLFLDFGQDSFGKQTLCNICGMLRVHGLDEDDVQHHKICKEYQEGVTHLGWKNERMVVAFNGTDDRILEVRSDDPLVHRTKVLEVQAIVNKELGFAKRQNDDIDNAVSGGGGIAGDINTTCYLYISKKRVVGLMMVKRIQRAYELLPPSNKETSHYKDNKKRNGNDNSSLSISRSLKPSRALLGIHQIWVHKQHRLCGIASKLVSAARDYLIFGMSVPIELIAFSSPTEEGLRFAKRYVGSDRPLIYDIH